MHVRLTHIYLHKCLYFQMKQILLLVSIVSGQGRIPLHSLMTEDELRFYFGDQVSTFKSRMMVALMRMVVSMRMRQEKFRTVFPLTDRS